MSFMEKHKVSKMEVEKDKMDIWEALLHVKSLSSEDVPSEDGVHDKTMSENKWYREVEDLKEKIVEHGGCIPVVLVSNDEL